jgi:hypothetical protein
MRAAEGVAELGRGAELAGEAAGLGRLAEEAGAVGRLAEEAGAVGRLGDEAGAVGRLGEAVDLMQASGSAERGAVGFADGLGQTALAANRLQHGTRHLTEAGLLPAWSGRNSPAIIERALTPILERPIATFDHTLGGIAVKGFAGEVAETRVAVFVYKEGPYQGQLATSFVPSPSQWVNWGFHE